MPNKYVIKSLCSIIALSAFALSSAVSYADNHAPKKVVKNTVDVRLKNSHPNNYTVVKGDTLWGIAENFLQNPWIWPQIWDANPQIKNPHLIYPGDIISVIYINGNARLHVERPSNTKEPTDESKMVKEPFSEGGLKVVKLSPTIRYEKQKEAIQAVEASAIESFIIKPKIFSIEEYDQLPYIIGNYQGRLISGLANEVYVRGLNNKNEYRYGIYHKGETFKDPENGDILGYEAILVGEAKILKFGDPATAFISNSLREILNGDRLVSADQSNISHNIIPTVSEIAFEGRIIALFDALSQSASKQVVTVNLGKRDGIEIGNILSVDRFGGSINDKKDLNEDGVARNIQIPNVNSGVLMIFKVFERVSYGLVMKAKRAIHINDSVTTPE